MSVLCGRPTPTGPCRRKVRAPGGPCGANHPRSAVAGPLPSAPAGWNGPDPLTRPDARTDLGSALDAASDPSTGSGRLDRLARHDNETVRLLVAHNPSAPAGSLSRLCSDPASKVRLAAARNPTTPGKGLGRLARDGDHEERWEAARHPNCPPAALARLVSDPDSDVRELAVAATAAADSVHVADLAVRGNWVTRERLASRPDLPAGLLAELANDPSEAVRSAARSNSGFTGPVAAHAGLISG